MPIILALETSTETASAALLYGEQLIACESPGVQTHSQTVLPMVQRLLAEAGMTLSQCDAIAFGAGPGSFTGVRTACGIAQGLASGADLPVIPIVTLKAMAQACREATGALDVFALLDARMNELYWARYCFTGEWRTMVEPTLSAGSDMLQIGDAAVCGNGIPVYLANAGARLPADDTHPAIMPHAKYVAQLGHVEFLAKRTVAARDAQPIYLRNKVALTTMERLARITA